MAINLKLIQIKDSVSNLGSLENCNYRSSTWAMSMLEVIRKIQLLLANKADC